MRETDRQRLRETRGRERQRVRQSVRQRNERAGEEKDYRRREKRERDERGRKGRDGGRREGRLKRKRMRSKPPFWDTNPSLLLCQSQALSSIYHANLILRTQIPDVSSNN